MKRREFLSLLAGTMLPSAARAADTYPIRPIHLIVPYPPGGGTDIVGRLLGEKLGASLKQPIVVDNRGGAGGVLGTEVAAKAAASLPQRQAIQQVIAEPPKLPSENGIEAAQ